MLDHLAASGVERTAGVDLSSAMIDQARVGHPDVPLAVAELAGLPFDDGAFRGVLAWYSIIHVAPEDCPAVLRELARVLTPGGVLLLSFQVGAGERRIDKAYGHDVAVRAHLHSSAHLGSVLVAEGLEVIATVDRAPRAPERSPQGCVLARRPEAMNETPSHA